jgi:hypothetical protein
MIKRFLEWAISIFKPVEPPKPIAKPRTRPQVKKATTRKPVAKKVAVKKTTTTRGKA